MDSLYPDSYEASRARFLQDAERLRARWADSCLESYPLKDYPDLSIDWLWAEPRDRQTLVVISTGQHGIEGYVGSGMLKLFMEEVAPGIDAGHTGLLLVHAINPWGMKHRLRVNPNGVDLNRNFILDGIYDPDANPNFNLLREFLNPQRPVRGLQAESAPFLFKVIRNILHPGRARLTKASLLGQYQDPTGIYFGGRERQEETAVLMELYRAGLRRYRNFIQMDMHTGYGPRYQMTVIVPPTDPIPSSEAARTFRYPLVQKIDADEFYAIHGDMGEYVYRLRDEEFPDKNVFACGFEFGTFGDSLPALVRSLRVTILENQLRQHGAVSERAREEIRAEYQELFLPADPAWRGKAIEDGRQAFEGILSAYGIL